MPSYALFRPRGDQSDKAANMTIWAGRILRGLMSVMARGGRHHALKSAKRSMRDLRTRLLHFVR